MTSIAELAFYTLDHNFGFDLPAAAESRIVRRSLIRRNDGMVEDDLCAELSWRASTCTVRSSRRGRNSRNGNKDCAWTCLLCNFVKTWVDLSPPQTKRSDTSGKYVISSARARL